MTTWIDRSIRENPDPPIGQWVLCQIIVYYRHVPPPIVAKLNYRDEWVTFDNDEWTEVPLEGHVTHWCELPEQATNEER